MTATEKQALLQRMEMHRARGYSIDEAKKLFLAERESERIERLGDIKRVKTRRNRGWNKTGRHLTMSVV